MTNQSEINSSPELPQLPELPEVPQVPQVPELSPDNPRPDFTSIPHASLLDMLNPPAYPPKRVLPIPPDLPEDEIDEDPEPKAAKRTKKSRKSTKRAQKAQNGQKAQLRARGQKRCTDCGEIQPLQDFAKHSTSSDGRASICNYCRNERNRVRRRTNPDARLKHLISSRAREQFIGHQEQSDITARLDEYLDVPIKKIRLILDKQCQADYNLSLLECIASGEYHIDHKHPLSQYKTETPGDAEFRACWHPDNLCVIPAALNLAKGSQVGVGYDYGGA